jgi:hypothetical protein
MLLQLCTVFSPNVVEAESLVGPGTPPQVWVGIFLCLINAKGSTRLHSCVEHCLCSIVEHMPKCCDVSLHLLASTIVST